MESKNLLTLAITLTVGIILAGSLLMPVISDATETEHTFTNDGYFRMTHVDDTTDHTITWTYEKPNTITVDGTDVLIDYHVSNGQVTVIADTNWIVRLYNDGAGEVSAVAMVASTGGTASAQVIDSSTATISLTSGEMSATFGNATRTGTYTDAWIPSNDGEFTMKKADKVAYINENSEIVGYGLSRVKTASGAASGSPGAGISLIGNIADGITANVWRGPEVTLSDAQINAQMDATYLDIYKLDSITATAHYSETVDGETVVTDSTVTYNYLLVPYQVTSELTQHLNPGEIAILNALPVLIIVALVVMATGALYLKRDD